MGGSAQGWFRAAVDGDLGALKYLKQFGSILEDQNSQYNGLSALHLSSIYENDAAYEYLLSHERNLLTKYPIELTCPRLNRKIPLPPGLSFQHILAIKGREQLLSDSLSEGIVESPVNLLACCLIGIPENFSHRNRSLLVEQTRVLRPHILSPIKISCVLGLKTSLNNFVDMAIEGDSDERNLLDECVDDLEGLTQWPESKCLDMINGNLLGVEDCRDILHNYRRSMSYSISEASVLRREISVYDFLKKE